MYAYRILPAISNTTALTGNRLHFRDLGQFVRDSSAGRLCSGLPSLEDTRIIGTIPVNTNVVNDQRFLFISKDQRAWTHGLHKYPAKFFPELPRWIIEKYTEKGEWVIDPFMGSGTTNLEAILLGRNSIGIDIDPFSRFLSTVKTRILPEDDLLNAHRKLERDMEEYELNKVVSEIPDFPYRDNWFKPHILEELAYIKLSINSLREDKKIKDFFLVCFSSIIRAVSQADNNCTRTVIRKKLNKKVNRRDAINLFLKKMEINIKGMLGLCRSSPSGTTIIPDNTSAKDLQGIRNDSMDLAVTSPPYMNAVDYPRTHQLELYWLGFANGSLQPLKSIYVGTEVVKASDYKNIRKTRSRLANQTISKIYNLDSRKAYIASKYIEDMATNMEEVFRVLKPGKRYVIVVGNNLVKGITFETWKYLKEIAPGIGYKFEKHFVSGIINHFIKVPRAERINDDHILLLRK